MNIMSDRYEKDALGQRDLSKRQTSADEGRTGGALEHLQREKDSVR